MTTYYRGFKVPSADANSKKTHAEKDVKPRLYRGAEYHVDQIAKAEKSNSGVYRGVSWGHLYSKSSDTEGGLCLPSFISNKKLAERFAVSYTHLTLPTILLV